MLQHSPLTASLSEYAGILRFVAGNCTIYSEGGHPQTNWTCVDYVRLCRVLLGHFQGYKSSDYHTRLARFGDNIWSDLWVALASAISCYTDNRAWSWSGPYERRLTQLGRFIPCEHPESILMEDRIMAEECLTLLPALEDDFRLMDDTYRFPDLLVESLGRFIPAIRRASLPVLHRIPQARLSRGLGDEWGHRGLGADLDQLEYQPFWHEGSPPAASVCVPRYLLHSSFITSDGHAQLTEDDTGGAALAALNMRLAGLHNQIIDSSALEHETDTDIGSHSSSSDLAAAEPLSSTISSSVLGLTISDDLLGEAARSVNDPRESDNMSDQVDYRTLDGLATGESSTESGLAVPAGHRSDGALGTTES